MMVRKAIMFYLAVVAVTVVTGGPASIAGEGKPVAVTESDSHDFGKVFAGSEVIHDFIIRNAGDAALEIQKVKAE